MFQNSTEKFKHIANRPFLCKRGNVTVLNYLLLTSNATATVDFKTISFQRNFFQNRTHTCEKILLEQKLSQIKNNSDLILMSIRATAGIERKIF